MQEFLKKHPGVEVKLTYLENEGIKVTFGNKTEYPNLQNLIISDWEIERSNIPLEKMIAIRLNDIYEKFNH